MKKHLFPYIEVNVYNLFYNLKSFELGKIVIYNQSCQSEENSDK